MYGLSLDLLKRHNPKWRMKSRKIGARPNSLSPSHIPLRGGVVSFLRRETQRAYTTCENLKQGVLYLNKGRVIFTPGKW